MSSKVVFICDGCGREIEEEHVIRDKNYMMDRYNGNHTIGVRGKKSCGFTFQIIRCDAPDFSGKEQLCNVCIGESLHKATELWDEKLKGGKVVCLT